MTAVLDHSQSFSPFQNIDAGGSDVNRIAAEESV
jgi:hypothetical protein